VLTYVLCELIDIQAHHDASIQNKMRNSAQSRAPVSYRRSGTARPVKSGPLGFPETSVGNYSSKQRKSPKEHRSHSHNVASLKLRTSTLSTDGRTGRQTGIVGGKRLTFFVAFHYENDTIYRTRSITCVFFTWSTKESWFDSRQEQRIFLPFRTYRVTLGSNQTPTQWGPGPLLGIKRPACEPDRSPPE
jgi:hypothetical protein